MIITINTEQKYICRDEGPLEYYHSRSPVGRLIAVISQLLAADDRIKTYKDRM